MKRARRRPQPPRLTVTPGFCLLCAAAWVLDGEVALLTALAALLHELGHCAALALLGLRVRALRLTGSGAELVPAAPLSYRQELPVALAGPAVGILAALVAARLRCFLFAGLSLALGLGNLLPIPPLDGGRAVQSLAALLLPPPWDTGLPRLVALTAASALLGAAALAALRGVPWLLLPAGWLLWQSFKNA